MSQQDGFGNNRTQPTGSSKPDDGDDGMHKKGENVAHAQDGIKRKNLKNSRYLRNSPPSGDLIDILVQPVRGEFRKSLEFLRF